DTAPTLVTWVQGLKHLSLEFILLSIQSKHLRQKYRFTRCAAVRNSVYRRVLPLFTDGALARKHFDIWLGISRLFANRLHCQLKKFYSWQRWHKPMNRKSCRGTWKRKRRRISFSIFSTPQS